MAGAAARTMVAHDRAIGHHDRERRRRGRTPVAPAGVMPCTRVGDFHPGADGGRGLPSSHAPSLFAAKPGSRTRTEARRRRRCHREVASGGIVVVVDDASRENEGDLIMAADLATPAALGFFVRHTSGVVCVALTASRCDQLGLPPMVPEAANTDVMGTAFTVTVDLNGATTTGISASDRAATVAALADPARRAGDFRRPGHVFPLRARPGGVLERPGHTEAAVELASLAGWSPAGVLAEVVRHDGEMARGHELRAVADQWNLPLISVGMLIDHRRRLACAAPPARTGEGRGAHAPRFVHRRGRTRPECREDRGRHVRDVAAGWAHGHRYLDMHVRMLQEHRGNRE